MENKKNLLLAPHVDDEVLGCGGILDSSFQVYYCGIDESNFQKDKDPTETNTRLGEIKKTAELLGFEWDYGDTSKVNHYTEQELVNKFEDLINETRPERIFLPHPGFNGDHRTVYNAAIIALRPHDRNFFVKKILIYEAIHDFLWNPDPMDLNFFIPIDIDKKINAYELQKSQIRGMRSSQMLKDLAKLRGYMANTEYAEAFEIKRWVE